MSGSRRGVRTRSNVAALTRAIILNLDILQIILSFVPRVDLLSVSCTSRFLREWAIKELLSRPVRIRLPKELESWCRFFLADENRPAHVRDLSIYLEDLESVSQRRAKLLLKFLQRATRLRRLFLGLAEIALNADPEIPSAISRLPALESFAVDPFCRDAQATTNEIIANMTSRLKVLSLYAAIHGGELWGYDIPRMLAPHREHLEELCLDFPDVRVLELHFPNLHTLKIPVNDQQPRPSSMFKSFPNLRHLSLFQDLLSYDHFAAVPEDLYSALRQSRMSEESGRRVWSSLDTLRGLLILLYVVGLTCPVRRLEIEGYSGNAHDAAVDVVKSTCPQKLLLDIRCNNPVRAIVREPSLLGSGSPDRQHVTHLTLRIRFTANPVPVNWEPLSDLAPLLRNSQVEYLRLVVGGSLVREDHLENELLIEGWVRQYLRALDLDALRDALVGATTTLRVLVFTMSIRGQTVWTVDRGGGTAKTTEVDPVDARELILREEA
ncbi:hypothetical protein K466DRAFT_602440 [Polyporus arcularius HHB13444]|uniref:F-box domain-containing protein n=1 Tax=Polyporus arcularius HHB13444 TaxID=1314778 RepID=A0A5C3P3V7_9APHY|nr:hypothetical protein K466DRAFT_602440 [Polyporus arcularius HHB13444]